MSDYQILSDLANSVINGDETKSAEAAKKALQSGIEPLKAINEGLMKGMAKVGEDLIHIKIYFYTITSITINP